MLVLAALVFLGGGEMEPRNKHEAVEPVFAAGPEVGAPDFDAWLAAQGEATVKLPFTIWRKPARRGALGVLAAPPAEVIRFSDAALGIPLDERLARLCPDREPCAVWLAGRFGELLAPGGSGSAARQVFSVLAVHEAVSGEGPHRAHVVRQGDCLAVRALKPGHCARGPERCKKCKAAEQEPAVPRLLDVCPYGDYARPTIAVERDGKRGWRAYDVLRSFASAEEAKEFARRYGISDVAL